MLSLHGFDINNEQHTMHDTAFLMEQLELREELDNIENSDDALDLLAKFMQNVKQMQQARSALMVTELDAMQWEKLIPYVNYVFDKLQQQAEQLEERLLDEF